MERLSRQTNRTPDPPGCFVVMPGIPIRENGYAVIDPGEALQWTQWDMHRIGWEVCNGA